MAATINELFATGRPVQPAPAEQADALARKLGQALDTQLYAASIGAGSGVVFAIARRGLDKELLLVTDAAQCTATNDFEGVAKAVEIDGRTLNVRRCPLHALNAKAIRKYVPYANPQALGTRTSAGMGDRLGLATPAHLAAVRGSDVAPVVAQQSIREMTRTGRSAQQVVDDATWGVLQAGWSKPWGADADHLKTEADIDVTAAAGFVMFTIDPGDHVDNSGDHDDGPSCRAKFDKLPWDELQISPADCREAYYDKIVALPGDHQLRFSEVDAKSAAVKYGRAIAHTVKMHRHLVSVMAGRPFELEMSVDETASPTTPIEHYFVANELRRLGVAPVSLAPRFVGKFEKGVDYQGDVAEFRHQFELHAAIARELGGYKLSLHSGSDKFSIYPIAAELTGGLVHLKTAGTSYLEALRAAARVDPALFREILGFAIDRYETDKASYHVSAELARVSRPDQLADDRLETVLDDFHARQVLHVTFGSVLTADGGAKFRDRLVRVLKEHEDVHYQTVSSHLRRHIEPFAGQK